MTKKNKVKFNICNVHYALQTIGDNGGDVSFGIPFELKLDVLNETTAAAIEEGRKIMSDPSAPRYSSMDALKAALEV